MCGYSQMKRERERGGGGGRERQTEMKLDRVNFEKLFSPKLIDVENDPRTAAGAASSSI